jgi:hypothetical protein
VLVSELLFDAKNPRLTDEAGDFSSQDEIFTVLWRDFAVDELVSSIAANGYFPHEPLFAVEEDSKLVVIEGNRRLAALKALLGFNAVEFGAVIPTVSKPMRESLLQVPVIVTTRDDIWQYIGFKHVNGPQAWQSASKAKYIVWVHQEFGVPLDDIARQIGDKHATVLRLYRASMVLDQAERTDVFHVSDRWKKHFSFSHLYTGLDYQGIQNFIEVAPYTEARSDPVPETRIRELGELCTWLYGSKARVTVPVVTSQNPDLRVLDEVVQSEDGLAALRQGLPLRTSREIGKGDPRVLRESLVAAKNSLQAARGKVVTGFQGQEDLVTLAEDIRELAEYIVEDLDRIRRRATRRRRDEDDE